MYFLFHVLQATAEKCVGLLLLVASGLAACFLLSEVYTYANIWKRPFCSSTLLFPPSIGTFIVWYNCSLKELG